MEEKYLYINGYWKNDKSEFNDYMVSTYDDSNDEDEDEDIIFFYGLSEENVKEAINLKENTMLDFVITSYYK